MKSQEGGGGVVVGHTYATLCLFPLSPRGAKARRATSTRREKGCAECSNRWDESSVLVRYALRLSSSVPFSFPSSHSLPLLLFLCPSFPFVQLFCLSRHIFLSPHLPVSILFHPFPQALLFVSASFLPLSLLFPLCLVLDMLPKTTSTLCFPLLTLECKRQREEEKELQKIDSVL